MNSNENREMVGSFESRVHDDLFGFLKRKGLVEEREPECPDVEELWPVIARAYLPDGAREFANYPVVSLGWMMFIGMAMACYWDGDWSSYSTLGEELYTALRDRRGYDSMDEAVVEEVLGLTGDEAEKRNSLAAECASRVYSMLSHQHVEPGTEAALGCYIAALHQLYLAGMAMELNALGYHMTPLN